MKFGYLKGGVLGTKLWHLKIQMWKSYHPLLQNVTVHGYMVFKGVIKLKCVT